MEININYLELTRLMLELNKRNISVYDTSNFKIKQYNSSGIGITTMAIVDGEEIDITDYSSW